MKQTAILAAGLACAAGPACAEAPFDFAHTPGQLPKIVVPGAYTIDLVPDLRALRLSGHEAVDITVSEATGSIVLNQAGLAIAHASLEDGSVASVATDDRAQTASLSFAKTVAPGRHVLSIDYTGPIPNSPAGIYYDDYKLSSGGSHRMLVTQFEVADARRMFPGWDEPAFKARFTLSATLPDNFAAVSNMPIAASTPAGAGRKRVQFAATPRMSTYLLALIAGEMSAIRDRAGATALAVWAPTGEQEKGRYALGVERKVLPFYNDYFGTAYPLPKLDMVAIPGNYAAGAMENWGAITYIDNALLFDAATSDARTRETVAIDVAHEMAHQWSGDLVTMAWWDNIWLNEGFATWMEYKAVDHFNPDWEIWPRQHEARELAMAQDAQPTTHPIQQVIRDVSEAGTAFDRISYQKGEQIIRMIEGWVGADIFRTGMRAYMAAHQYSNATSADLWAALSQASGKDVASLARGFTEQPGVPMIHVTRRCVKDQGTLSLSQDRFAIHDPKAAKLIWTIPVSLGEPGGAASHLLLGAAPQTVPLSACDAAVKANLGEDGYYRVQYDAASLKPLLAHFSAFGPADRANLLGDQYAMFQAGRAPLDDYLDMLPALADERDTAVWQETLPRLRALDMLARASAVRPAYRAFAAGLIRPEFNRLGWDAKPGEPFLDTLLRPLLIAALGDFDDTAIIAEAQRRFAAFVASPTSLAPDLRAPVLAIIGHHADQQTYDTLRRLGEAAPGTEEKLRYFAAMAGAGDPALIAQTMQFAASGQIPPGRIASVINTAAATSDNPDEVYKQLVAGQDPIRKLLSAEGQARLLPAGAAGTASSAIARALVADPASHASIGAKIIAARTADAIATRAELAQRAAPAIAARFKAGK
jgi:aminopeptidase N